MSLPTNLDDHKQNTSTFTCPHCGVQSLHTKKVTLTALEEEHKEFVLPGKQSYYPFKSTTSHFIFRCVACGKDTYILYRSGLKNEDKLLKGAAPDRVIHQYPVVTPTSDVSIPPTVTGAAIEAEKCLSVGAYNACGVMTRRAMHALCDDKGGKGKDLFHQLESIKNANAITPDLWEWAEELRVLGRNGAHTEFEEVTAEDAEYAVKFLREIVRYVYVLPAERAARRVKETSVKKP